MKKRMMSVLLAVLLSVMGLTGALADTTPGEACEHDWSNKDGVCVKCGATCSHPERTQNGGTQKNKTCQDNGNGTHTRSFDVYHNYVCTTCGNVEERFIERGTETENHIWKSDSTCAECGRACTHDWQNGKCTACGKTCTHSWNEATCQAPKTCATCGLTEGEANGHNWQNGECTSCHTACTHQWENGVCAVCGMACTHNWNEATCQAPKTCTVCGMTEGEKGVHAYAQTATYDKERYSEKDDGEHWVFVEHYRTMTCENCGDSYDEIVGDAEQSARAHDWSKQDGTCKDCGYVCKHPKRMHTYNAEESWEEALPSVAENENTHTDHYIVHDVFDCACGGKFYAPAPEQTSPGHPHVWESGTCKECGYVCQHPTSVKDGDPIRTDGVEYLNGDAHIQYYDFEQMMKCAVCGRSTPSVITDGEEVSVPHTYVNGVCACGAKEPAPVTPPANKNNTGNKNNANTVNKPKEPESEETEAIVEEESLPEPEPKLTLVETLVGALAETVIEAETAGKAVNIEIVGAQEVMTETEYTQLKTLAPQEQILVTLASIGFEDVVSAAVESMNDVELSEGAQSLMETVRMRRTEMNEEERAQLEEKLTAYFPVQEIDVDGVTYPYFIMEMEIDVDGEITIRRYGFRMDENGEWIFVMLDEI